jgi:hypothetical protein
MIDTATQSLPANLVAALDYIARGWSAIPLCAWDHTRASSVHVNMCNSPGKAPIWKWSEFQHRIATPEELQIAWTDNRHLNVGVVLGPVSGIVGIDVDSAAGDILLDELSGGDLPATVTFNTGGSENEDGEDVTRYRLLYSVPKTHLCKTTGFQRDGVEVLKILGHGTQTVMPPSRHKSGGMYRWHYNKSPGDIEVAPAPAWLLAQLAAPQQHNTVGYVSENSQLTPGQALNTDDFRVPEGSRNNTLAAFAGAIRRHGANRDEILALLNAVNDRCQPPLPQTEVNTIATSICRYAPTEPPNFQQVVKYGPTRKHYKPDIVNLHDVECQPKQYLWKPWFPLRTYMMFDGEGGTGKSTVLLDIAARLSRHDYLPDGSKYHEPVNVIVISHEDDLETVFKPKLLTVGANLDRIHYFTKVIDDKGELVPFLIPDHLYELEQKIRETNSKLIIVDPFFATWNGGDHTRLTDARRVCSQMIDLTTMTDTCLVCVRHFTKGSAGQGKGAYRGEGSLTFINTARANLAIFPRDDDEANDNFTLGTMQCTKANNDKKPRGLNYQLRPVNNYCVVDWLGQSDETADSLAGPEYATEESRSQLHRAVEIITELANAPNNPYPGAVKTTTLNERLEIDGISKMTGWRAAKKLQMTFEDINGFQYRRLPQATGSITE